MEAMTLEPCPFCGGESWVVDVYDTRRFRPQCKKCGADLGEFRREADAVSAWNRRAHLAQPAQAVDVGVRPICQNSAESADLLTNTSKLVGEVAAAWRLRIGDSDVWSFCTEEWQADFYGKQSGLPYEKEPLYTRALSGEKAGPVDGWTARRDDELRLWWVYSPSGAAGGVYDQAAGVHAELLRQLAQFLPASPTPDKEGEP